MCVYVQAPDIYNVTLHYAILGTRARPRAQGQGAGGGHLGSPPIAQLRAVSVAPTPTGSQGPLVSSWLRLHRWRYRRSEAHHLAIHLHHLAQLLVRLAEVLAVIFAVVSEASQPCTHSHGGLLVVLEVDVAHHD